jgi:PAS domain S-box-containing protein
VPKLTVASRLYLPIGLSTLALLMIVGATLVGSGKMLSAGRSLYDQGVLAIEQTSRLALLFEEQEQLVGRAPADIDRNRIAQYRARFEYLSEKLSFHLARLAPVADSLTPNGTARLPSLFGEYSTEAGVVFDLSGDFLQDKANDVLNGRLSVLTHEIDAILDELLDAAAKAAGTEVAILSHAREGMIWTIAGVSLFGVLVFNGMGVYVARRLTRDLGRIIAEMRALSAGDLDSQMAVDGDPDEIGGMARALEVFKFEIIAGQQMAAEVRRSQEHLARAQRIARMGSDFRNLRTDEAEWSDELYRIFGVSRDTFVPSTPSLLELVHPDDRAMVLSTREQVKKGICPDPFEHRIVRPDGSVRHIRRECELIRDEAGNPACLTGTCHDVTEIRAAQSREKDLERQLMHSQKLEALGTLAGGVAHDLNNTLVPILALSKVALDELPKESPVRSDLEIIMRASERARDLVKQILAFSRKRDLGREEVDLAWVARDALQMLRASVPATTQFVDEVLEVPPVFGDAGELHQVIVNLLTNAAQAIGGGVGRINVKVWETAQQHFSNGETAPAVCVSVTDTGCGMDEATLDRIFEPFFTTKAVGEGTGLGLSVVHGIATRHGGMITARSTPGKGSEFTLSLPASSQPQVKRHGEAVAA